MRQGGRETLSYDFSDEQSSPLQTLPCLLRVEGGGGEADGGRENYQICEKHTTLLHFYTARASPRPTLSAGGRRDPPLRIKIP